MENQLWKQIKDPDQGNKSFKSANALWKRSLEYFEWCDNNPFYKSEQLKKPGTGMVVGDKFIPGETLVDMPVKRPYTLKGLCIFLGVNEKYFNTFVRKHEVKEIKVDRSDWLEVIAKIKDIVGNQQYEGAAAGFFQANIVARMLGLADKTEAKNETTVKEVIKIGDQEFEL